jgi:DNA-binding transcriptional ArsR family regulator
MGAVFKSLSVPARRDIPNLLKVSNLRAPSISRRLIILYAGGLVLGKKQGRNVICSWKTTILQDIPHWIKTLKGDNNEH